MAGGKGCGGLGLSAVVLWLASGCMAPPEDAEARLAELQAEGVRMDAALEEVETRLLGNQARVYLWTELGRRHREVSAIQCRVADEHLMGMAKNLEHQAEKARRIKKARRMASVDSSVLTSGSRERLSNN